MLNLKNNNLVLVLIIFLYIISLYIGFYLGEDLSTGGSNWDFNQTWPVVVDFSNNILDLISIHTEYYTPPEILTLKFILINSWKFIVARVLYFFNF